MNKYVVFIYLNQMGGAKLFVDAAVSANLTPILLTKRPREYTDIADLRTHKISSINFDEVIKAIENIGSDRVAGVFTQGTKFVPLAAKVAKSLGLPHSDLNAIETCLDKIKMRNFFSSDGESDVRYQLVNSAAGAHKAANDLGGAVVVKPHTSSGSKGVRICRTPEETSAYCRQLLRKNPEDLLIEEFIDGPVFCVDVFDGKALAVRRNYTPDLPVPLMVGADCPADLTEEVAEEIADYAIRHTNSIGYTRGAAAVQVVHLHGKNYLIEINPRASAIMGLIGLNSALGIDLPQLCLKFACGVPYDLEVEGKPSEHNASSIRFLVRTEQPSQSIIGIDEAKSVPHVVDLGIYRHCFFQGGAIISNSDCIAYVLSKSNTVSSAANSADTAISKLKMIPASKFHASLMNTLNFFKKTMTKLW